MIKRKSTIVLASSLVALLAATSACLEGPRHRRPPPAPPAARAVGRRALPPGGVERGPLPPISNAGLRRSLGFLGQPQVIGAADVDGSHRLALVGVSDTTGVVIARPDGTLLGRAGPHGTPYFVASAPAEVPRAALVAWGYGRGHLGAPTALIADRLGATPGAPLAETVLDVSNLARNQPVALEPVSLDGGALLFAHYQSKYFVRVDLGRAAPQGGLVLSPLATFRMGVAFAVGDLLGGGRPVLAVGRLYGDTIDQPGDAFLVGPAGARGTAIPTTRGVHAMVVADLDGDGRPELYLADGWDREYGAKARALLTRVTFAGGVPRSTVLTELPGEFLISELYAGDLDGDGRPELVAVGNAYVAVVKWTPAGLRVLYVAGPVDDAALADLDGKGVDTLLLAGEKPEAVSLRGVSGPYGPLPPPPDPTAPPTPRGTP